MAGGSIGSRNTVKAQCDKATELTKAVEHKAVGLAALQLEIDKMQSAMTAMVKIRDAGELVQSKLANHLGTLTE